MPNAAPDAAPSWLVTVAQLPVEDPASRMRVLRTLESLGAAVMREGAYLLPDSPENRRALDALADYATKGGGVVHVLQVAAISPTQNETFRRLFDRSARYENLIKTVESLRVGFGQTDPSAISRVLHKQRRELESIAALDFFPTEARTRAQRALAECEAEVKKLLFPAHAKAPLGPGETLLRRTWATRKPPWADRLACAWLIRRFIDPDARFLWLPTPQDCPTEAIGFDFDGAAFTHTGHRVTFEVLVTSFDLATDPALRRLGVLVHALDVGGVPVPEAAGFEAILTGVRASGADDDQMLAAMLPVLDALYTTFGQETP